MKPLALLLLLLSAACAPFQIVDATLMTLDIAKYARGSSHEIPRSKLVCNPVGETVVDPASECHSEITQPF